MIHKEIVAIFAASNIHNLSMQRNCFCVRSVGFVPNTIEEGMLDSGKDAFFMSNIKLFTKMENNNTTVAEYSQGAIERDKESLNLNAEAVVNATANAAEIAARHGYPANAVRELYDTCDELTRQIFLVTNYLTNPAAADIVDGIAERYSKLQERLKSNID